MNLLNVFKQIDFISLKTRLMLVFSLILLFAVIQMIIFRVFSQNAYTRQVKTGGEINLLSQKMTKEVSLLGQIDMMSQHEQIKTDLYESCEKYNYFLKGLINGDPGHGIPRVSDSEIRDVLTNLQTVWSQVDEMYQEVRADESMFEIYIDSMREILSTDNVKMLELSGKATAMLSDAAARSDRTGTIITIVIIFLQMAAIVGAILMLLLPRFRNLDKISHRMQDIVEGEGDLTKRINITIHDEIGRMGSLFNMFIEKIQKIMSSLAKDSDLLFKSSGDISGISSSVLSNADVMKEKAEGTTQSSSLARDSMENVSKTISDTSLNLQTVSASAEQMTSTITEVARNAEKARQATEDGVRRSESSGKRVNQLNKQAEEIDKIIRVVVDISEQTKLLALNATIESARAGESGKGFAVVANEVKELARKTSESAADISKLIKTVKLSITETVDNISGTRTIIDEINEIVASIASSIEEQSISTREISTNISHTSGMLNDASSVITETRDRVKEAADNSEMTSGLSRDVQKSSNELSAAAETLKNMSANLKEVVDSFRI